VIHRLRQLEEVDTLRHLTAAAASDSTASASSPADHVITFVDAWEEQGHLFIQTELCMSNLAFFLNEYGQIVERLDEARVWKILAELVLVSEVILMRDLLFQGTYQPHLTSLYAHFFRASNMSTTTAWSISI